MRGAFLKSSSQMSFLFDNLLTIACLALFVFVKEFPKTFTVLTSLLDLLLHHWANLDKLNGGTLTITCLAFSDVLTSLACTSLTNSVSFQIKFNRLAFVNLLQRHVDNVFFRFDFWFVFA